MEVDEGENATVAFCVAKWEAAVGMVPITELVEITTDANVVELLIPSEVVWFRSAPLAAFEMGVTVGVNIIGILLSNGGELLGFDGLVGWDVLIELAAVSTSASLRLALLE